MIILAILDYFPHAFSTVVWGLTYGTFANLVSKPIRKALWKGDQNIPIIAGAVALALTVGIIIVGFVLAKQESEAKLARQKSIQYAIQEANLPGKWGGKMDNKKATLVITQEGNQFSGKIYYEGVEEKLALEIEGNGQIVLKGISYKRLSGRGDFALDTFYVTSINSTNLEGNYVDKRGNKGRWSVSKSVSDSQIKGIVTQLPGVWRGGVGNKEAELSIYQDGGRLSGRILYEGVEEALALEIGNGQIVLKGISYKRLSGRGSFSLDTFYGIMSNDGRSITGNYEDTAGNRGKWSVSKEREELEQDKALTEEKNQIVVFVKGGCYQMGDTFGDGDEDAKPVHEVCVDDFYMAKYEVTQKEWFDVMRNNPSEFGVCDNCPVEQVSWDDAQEYINKLNQKTGKNYRLPTEAEWEYAARSGGKNEKYAGGNDIDSVAWYSDNSGDKTHPVGQKNPNGLGIYDMSGNVWEWVNDWYDENYYENSPKDNPKGPDSGQYRVLRGGSWANEPMKLRAALRLAGVSPEQRDKYVGFRLVLSRQVAKEKIVWQENVQNVRAMGK